MRRFAPYAGILLLCLVCAAVQAGADEIELHNGNVIEGEIVRETETHVVVRTDCGEMTLSRSSIKEIRRFRVGPSQQEKPGEAEGGAGGGLDNPDPWTEAEREEWSRIEAEGRPIAAWVQDLASPDRRTKLRAVSILVQLGRQALPWLVDVLEKGPDRHRIDALFVLDRMKAKAKGALPAVAKLARSASGKGVRHAALSALLSIQGAMRSKAVPTLDREVVRIAEEGAVGLVKVFALLQQRFREAVYVDQDGDGRGENGLLGELAGARACRGGRWVQRPLIDRRLGRTDDKGRATFLGYYFILYLPGPGRAFTDANPVTGVAADRQEKEFVCYAFPMLPGRSGQKVFAITAAGRVMVLPNRDGRWGGSSIPPPGLAFQSGRDPSNPAAAVVRDGQKGGASERWEALAKDENTGDKRVMVITVTNLYHRALDEFLDELRRMDLRALVSMSARAMDFAFKNRFEKTVRAAGYASADELFDKAARVLGSDRFTDLVRRLVRERKKKAEDLVEELVERFKEKGR